MPKQGHKLAALRLLGEGMRNIERQRQERVKGTADVAEVDRDSSQMALNGIAMFFQEVGIEAKPVIRLLAELAALTAGSRLSPMLTPAPVNHRPSDPPTIESVKGRLAAIMEFRQQAGLSRKAAATWVLQHLPPIMKRGLGVGSAATVDSWLTKWGGKRGATSGDGRAGYLDMRKILHDSKPPEPQLKIIIRSLAGWVPPKKSK